MATHWTLTRICCSMAIGLATALASYASASDKLAKQPGFVYVASFNVFKLGGVEQRYKRLKGIDDVALPLDEKIPDRIRNIARVLAVGDFDLVTLQEVHEGGPGRAALSDLVRVLEETHGISYRFMLSDGIGRGLIPEAMAFLYQPRRVQHEPVNDTGSNSIRIEIDGRDLVQTQWEAGHFDFTVISAHLAWGDHKKRHAGYRKIREILDRPSGWSTDPDVVVLGDFNRYGDGATAVQALPYDPHKFRVPNIAFFDPDFSGCKQVKDCNYKGKGLPYDDPQLLSTTVASNTFVYDMIMFSRDASEEFPASLNQARYGIDFGIIHFDHPTGFGFQPGADNLKHNLLKEAYSDHRPIWLRFRSDLPSVADD